MTFGSLLEVVGLVVEEDCLTRADVVVIVATDADVSANVRTTD